MKRLLFLLFLLPVIAIAQRPTDFHHDRSKWVDDFGSVYTPEEQAQLSGVIRNFFDTVQIALVTIPTFGDYSPQEFATQLHREWGVGGKSSNGLTIVISKQDHKMFISTGYGIEGVLPDIKVKDIEEEFAVPQFKQGNYFQGTYDLLNACIAELNGTAQHQREVATEILNKEKEAQKVANQRTWQSIKEVVSDILLAILALSILGYILYKRHKKKQETKAKINDLRIRLVSAKETINIYEGVAAKATQALLEEGTQIKSLLASLGTCDGIDPSQIPQATAFLQKFDAFISSVSTLRSNLEKKISILQQGSDLIDNTKSNQYLLSAYNNDVKNIDQMFFDKNNYDATKNSYKEAISTVDDNMKQLTAAVNRRDVAQTEVMTAKLKQNMAAINGYSTAMREAYQADNNMMVLAKTAKRKLQDSLDAYRSYLGREGVSDAAAASTTSAIAAVEAQLTGFSDDLRANLLLYNELSKRCASCNAAKLENEAYVEQQRKIQSEIARKKKEAEEEEERRRRRVRDEEDERQRQSSMSYSSYSSSSSSSWDSGGSSFGGGSAGGGGAGASW